MVSQSADILVFVHNAVSNVGDILNLSAHISQANAHRNLSHRCSSHRTQSTSFMINIILYVIFCAQVGGSNL